MSSKVRSLIKSHKYLGLNPFPTLPISTLVKHLLSTTLFLAVSFSTSAGMTPEEFKKAFDEVCSYDRYYCSRVSDDEGITHTKPLPKISRLLRTLEPQIRAAGLKWDVDPRVIAGAILTENSLNVTMEDELTGFLTRYKVTNGKILGKSYGIGLGAIHSDTAYAAELHTAKLRGEKPRSEYQLVDELNDPAKAVEIAARIIRHAQDVYKKAGFDVSDKPEILATLYNLGRYEQRAQTSKERGTKPRMNYFGLFLKVNFDAVSYLGPRVKKPATPPRAVAGTTPASKGAAKPAPKSGPQKRAELDDGSISLAVSEESIVPVAYEVREVTCSPLLSKEKLYAELKACNSIIEDLKSQISATQSLNDLEKAQFLAKLHSLRYKEIDASLKWLSSYSDQAERAEIMAFAKACQQMKISFEADARTCSPQAEQVDELSTVIENVAERFKTFSQDISSIELKLDGLVRCKAGTRKNI